MAAAQTSSLFRLPQTARDNIYRMLIPIDEVITISDTGMNGNPEFPALPSILQTCQQLRREASAIYYTCNIFAISLVSFLENDLLIAWLQHLTTAERSSLRTVRLDSEKYDEDEVEGRIQECRDNLDDAGVPIDGATLWVELRETDEGLGGEWATA